MLPPNSHLTATETILSSRDGSETIQDPHCDLDEEYDGTALLAFVAIHPDTTIIIYPGSHKIHEHLQPDYPPRRYALEVGDTLLFHPRLIHCGDRYPESNIRIHYYIFAEPRLVWDNITFPLRDGELPLLEMARNRLINRENRVEGRVNVRRARGRCRVNFLLHVRPRRLYPSRR